MIKFRLDDNTYPTPRVPTIGHPIKKVDRESVAYVDELNVSLMIFICYRAILIE